MPVQTLKPGRCQAIRSSTSTFAIICHDLPGGEVHHPPNRLQDAKIMHWDESIVVPLRWSASHLFSPARVIVLEVDPMPSSATWASGEVSERSRFDHIDLDDLYRSVICNFGKAMLWCNLQFFLLTDRDLFPTLICCSLLYRLAQLLWMQAHARDRTGPRAHIISYI